MKKITLSKGKYKTFAIIDDEDFERVNLYSWSVDFSRSVHTAYAETNIKKPNGKKTTLYLHRLILNPGPNLEVDHINGNGLDNRKENLRVATRNENARNLPKQKRNTSGFKGVDWHKPTQKWRAKLSHNSKTIHLGLFDNPRHAAICYDLWALFFYGEYARLNFSKF